MLFGTSAIGQTDSSGVKLPLFLQREEARKKDPNQRVVDPTFARQYALANQANQLADLNAQLAEYQYRKATREYYIKDLDYRGKVFTWQYTSARMTFAVAVLIVCCGLLFSGIQFRLAMKQATIRLEQLRRHHTRKAASPDPDKHDDLATTLKLSTQGIEISSSILGVIVLGLSLAFFYLYLVYVFPIKETNFDMSGVRTEQQENAPPVSGK